VLAVISPHLDDAVYSTWVHLTRSDRVRIVSVFAGVPDEGTMPAYYDHLTRSGDPHARMQQRRDEDLAVCRPRGWESVHLDHLDAPYRAGDLDLDRVADSFSPHLGQFELVLVPSAIGLHEDHVAARDAALAVIPPGVETRLYADLPYATSFGWPRWVFGANEPGFLDVDAFYSQSLAAVDGRLGSPETHRLSEDEQAEKIAAILMYASQFDAMEAGPTRGLTHPDRICCEVSWPLS
jgi:hypothetical protein